MRQIAVYRGVADIGSSFPGLRLVQACRKALTLDVCTYRICVSILIATASVVNRNYGRDFLEPLVDAFWLT